MTQEVLAHEAGITTGTHSLIERGRSNPALGTISRIAEALGASMGEVSRPTDKYSRS